MKNIEKNLDVIRKNADEILKGYDNCVIALMDSLTLKFIKSNELKYIETLDSICRVSDGYVGEILAEECEELFYKNFKGFFQYLYRHRNDNNCFENQLVWEISLEMNMAEDREKAKREVDSYLKDKIRELKLSEREIEYLKKIQAQFDPAKFD